MTRRCIIGAVGLTLVAFAGLSKGEDDYSKLKVEFDILEGKLTRTMKKWRLEVRYEVEQKQPKELIPLELRISVFENDRQLTGAKGQPVVVRESLDRPSKRNWLEIEYEGVVRKEIPIESILVPEKLVLTGEVRVSGRKPIVVRLNRRPVRYEKKNRTRRPFGNFPSRSRRSTISCDDPYTIWCFRMAGSDHETITENLAFSLKRQLKPELVNLVHNHDVGFSAIYYGEYCPSVGVGPKFSKSAHRDLKRIRKLSTRDEKHPFLYARFESSPFKSIGPDEWNLCSVYERVANSKNPVAYTLTIAVYHSDPERRSAAVEMVRMLREENGVEAYFYHSPNRSKVSIGAFPGSAVQFVRSGDPSSPDRMTIVDPLLKSYKKKFPHFYENNRRRKHIIPDAVTGKPAAWGFEASKLDQIPDCGGQIQLPW